MFLEYNKYLLYFYHGFMIYIILIFSYFDFLNFKKIMTNVYLFKNFNFISFYDGNFSNFNCYKCLCSNATKHFKIKYEHSLKYAFK